MASPITAMRRHCARRCCGSASTPVPRGEESEAEGTERQRALLHEQCGQGDRKGLQSRESRVQETAAGQGGVQGTQGGIGRRGEGVRIELGERTDHDEGQDHAHREGDDEPSAAGLDPSARESASRPKPRTA